MGKRRKKGKGCGSTSAATAIPPGAMEMVQRVKEVVDLSDDKIYAALVECKMNPDEAVHSLMFQGDIHDGGPSISMQMSSSDFGFMHGKIVQEKDNGTNTISTSSILSSGMDATNSSPRLTPQSDSDSINTSQSTGPVDNFSFSSQPPRSFQPYWSGEPAHPTMADTVRKSGCEGKDSSTPIVPVAPVDSINISCSTGPVDNFSVSSQLPFSLQQNWSRAPARPTMADIVRMDGRQRTASSTTIVATDGYQSKSCVAVGLNETHRNSMLNQNTVLPVELNWESHSSHDDVSNVTEINRDPGGAGIQQISHEEFSLADQPSVRSSQIVSEISDASANYVDEPALSSLHVYGIDLSFLNDNQVLDGTIGGQNLPTESINSASASDRQGDNSGYGFLHVQGHHEADSVNTSRATGPVDNFSFSSRPPFGFQRNWSGAPARPTMADVVRMGRCKQKASGTTIAATDKYQSKSCDAGGLNESQSNSILHQNTVLPVELNWESHSSHDHVSNVTVINHDPGGDGFRQHDECSLADQPSVRSVQIVSEIFDASANYADESAPSSFHANQVDLSFLNDDQVLDGIIGGQNLPTESINSASASDRQVDNSGYGFPHVQRHHEAEDAGMELSLVTSNLQQLSLYEEHDTAPTESCPAVIIPDHLQVTNADCSCCLGTSGSDITGPSTGPFVPRPLKSNLELASDTDTHVHSIGQPDSRISEDHHDERIGPFSDDSVSFITRTSTDNSGMLSTSQPEVIRNDTFVPPHTIQQNFPSSSGYAFSNTTQPIVAAYRYRQSRPIHPFGRYLPPAAIWQSPAMLHGAGTRYTISADVAPGHRGFWNSANIPGRYGGTPSTFSARRRVGYEGDPGSRFRGINRFLPPPKGTRTAAALPGGTSFRFRGRNQRGGFREGQRPWGYPGHYGSREVFSEEYQQHLSAAGNFDISQRPWPHRQRRY